MELTETKGGETKREGLEKRGGSGNDGVSSERWWSLFEEDPGAAQSKLQKALH